MIMAGLGVTIWTDSPALIAIAALARRDRGLLPRPRDHDLHRAAAVSADWRRAIVRTFLLLVAEFGVAELLDTLLIRPAALVVGVWLLPDPMWGLLVGKVFADVVFYAIAAGAFTLTAKTGLRDGRRSREQAS